MSNFFQNVVAYVKAHKVTTACCTAAVAVAVGASVWFLSNRKADLTSALPEDSFVVGKIDFAQFAEGDNMLADALKSVVSEDEIKEKIKESGVDITNPAYVFAHQNNMGVVIGLRDEKDFLDEFVDDVEKWRGLKIGTLEVEDKFMVATDGKRAMIIGPVMSAQQDEMRQDIYKWMKKQKECKVSEKLMKAVEESKGLCTAAFSYGNLPSIATKEIHRAMVEVAEQSGNKENVMKEVEKMEKMLEDMILSLDFSITNDEFALDLAISGVQMDKMLEQYIPIKPINGSLAGVSGIRPFFHAEMGVDGAKLLASLQQIFKSVPEARTAWLAANMMLDLNQIVKSINGDMSITIPEFQKYDVPPMLVQAELKNDSFMQNVNDWNGGVSEAAGLSFSPYRDDLYVAYRYYEPYYFGTKNNRLFISNNEYLTSNVPTGNNAVPADAKGALGYMCFNLESLNMWDQIPGIDYMPRKLQEIKNFNRAMVVVKDFQHIRFSLGKWNK